MSASNCPMRYQHWSLDRRKSCGLFMLIRRHWNTFILKEVPHEGEPHYISMALSFLTLKIWAASLETCMCGLHSSVSKKYYVSLPLMQMVVLQSTWQPTEGIWHWMHCHLAFWVKSSCPLVACLGFRKDFLEIFISHLVYIVCFSILVGRFTRIIRSSLKRGQPM